MQGKPNLPKSGGPNDEMHSDPEGSSTQSLRSLVPKMVVGTRVLKFWVLGPFWDGYKGIRTMWGTACTTGRLSYVLLLTLRAHLPESRLLWIPAHPDAPPATREDALRSPKVGAQRPHKH